ncbi:maltase 1 [Biomphalaria glabrata]|nr:maltase 1 [Biomphalaria glabrata]
MRSRCKLLAIGLMMHFYWTVDGQSLLDSLPEVTPDANQTLTWWKTGVIYQVYPRSFKDSDGDGIGDIKGLISELDYFVYLGIDCIWLSPVYKSPMRDFGYDVSDFKDIDPIFGTIDDFKTLTQEVHNRGLKLITDFVPNHVSTDHEWFKKSVKRDGKYANYFIWHDGKRLSNGTVVEPNNWLSAFGGSAWQWNSERQEYYYHEFDPSQADLNYRDENLRWEMEDTLKYWLDLGVDGFRVDAFAPLYEVQNVSLDEPVSGLDVPASESDYLKHIYTTNQPESIPTLSKWYDIMNDYVQRDGQDRYMIVEVFSTVDIRNRVYVTGACPFNFDLLHMSDAPTGREILDTIMNEYSHLPTGKWPNFVLGNHDSRRISHKYGSQYVNVYNMLLLTLWGTPTTYYGEELGMLEAVISWADTVDPAGRNAGPERYQNFTRDPERSPMQWTPGYQSGFTKGNSTWLPLALNHTLLNVQTERESQEQTTLKLYKELVALRKKQAFQTGKFKVSHVDDDIVCYTREGAFDQYLVILNFGHSAISDLRICGATSATVAALTPGVTSTAAGQRVQLELLILKSGHGIILRLDLKT